MLGFSPIAFLPIAVLSTPEATATSGVWVFDDEDASGAWTFEADAPADEAEFE